MMGIMETLCGVVCGFAMAAFGVVVASGIAYLILDPFQGPFLVRM